jgi:hypothetical protein
MSLLHPTEEDDAFDAAHAEAGRRAMIVRVRELNALLDQAKEFCPEPLRTKIAGEVQRKGCWGW